MRTSLLLSLMLVFICFSCKTDSKKQEKVATPEKSIAEKIAAAHGYDNWKSVQEFAFTFNVDRDSSHFERSWVWKPKTNQVTSITQTDTITYNRKSMDSIASNINAGFINDRYWVLAPFLLVWDADNYTFEHQTEQKAPISGESMQKFTIVYGNEGGYTPGDAYDFYLDDNFVIREWIFRKTNQAEPSMITTWESYKELGGLLLAQDHKKDDGSLNLKISGLEVVQD